MLNAKVIEKKPPVNSRHAHFGRQSAPPPATAAVKGDAAKTEKKTERTVKAVCPIKPRRSQSQPVAVIFWKGVAKAGVLLYREPLFRPACPAMASGRRRAATLSPLGEERGIVRPE
jgi:hypothetical protein